MIFFKGMQNRLSNLRSPNHLLREQLYRYEMSNIHESRTSMTIMPFKFRGDVHVASK